MKNFVKILFILTVFFSFNASSEEVFLSKEDFLKIAFDEDVPRRKGLRFKNEVQDKLQEDPSSRQGPRAEQKEVKTARDPSKSRPKKELSAP